MYFRNWIFPITCLSQVLGCVFPQQTGTANRAGRTAVRSAVGSIKAEIQRRRQNTTMHPSPG